MKNKKQSSKRELDNSEKARISRELRPLPLGKENIPNMPRDIGSNIDRSPESPWQDWAETEEDF